MAAGIKNSTIVILIITLSLLVGGVAIYQYTNSHDYIMEKHYQACLTAANWQAIHITALKTNNPTLCNDIKREDYQKFCIAEITKDPSHCEGLEPGYKEFCLWPLTKNMEDCLAWESEAYCEMKNQQSPEPCKLLDTGDPRDQEACEAWGRLDSSFFENEVYFKSLCSDFTGLVDDWGVFD